MANTITAGNATNGGTAISSDTSGTLELKTGSSSTTALTLDTSGNLQMNSGYGSVATAYGCRAWVNFNGTGTVAIRASGNVSSITDNGTGDYTVNFTTAMPDINYSASLSFSRDPDCPSGNIATNNATGGNVAPTTTALRVGMYLFGVGGKDVTYINIAVFR